MCRFVSGVRVRSENCTQRRGGFNGAGTLYRLRSAQTAGYRAGGGVSVIAGGYYSTGVGSSWDDDT